jgi:hypothetical protein
MNALQVADAVRRHGASLSLRDGQLVLRGSGEALPDSLKNEIAQHKAELMVALGCPMDRTVATILDEIRPHLSPALRRLPDDRLLALVNWHIIAAWEKTIQAAMQR